MKSAAGISLACAAFLLAAAAASGFFTVHNDFWGSYFLSTIFSFTHPATWHNGFFPAGYTAVLKAIAGSGYPSTPAMVLNCGLSLLVFVPLALLPRLFSFGPSVSLLSAGLALLFPRLFHYLMAAGPEAGATAFFSAGAALLLYAKVAAGDDRTDRRLLYVCAGLLFGLGGLFRTHVLYGAVIFVICSGVLFDRSLIMAVFVLAGLLPALLVQAVSAHAAGAPLFQSSFSYYVYNLMYGINWYHAADLHVPGSALTLIRENPFLFAKAAMSAALTMLPLTVMPPAATFLLTRFSRAARALPRPEECSAAAGLYAVFACVYGVLTAASGSGRAVLLPLPLALFFLAAALALLYRSYLASRAGKILAISCIAALFLVFIAKDISKIRLWQSLGRDYGAVELAARQCGAVSASEIFSTDYDVFFRRLMPFKPLSNGGWLKFKGRQLPGLQPDFDLSSAAAFYGDCMRRGVKLVCLGPESIEAAPFLGVLYRYPGSDQRFSLVVSAGSDRLFRLR